MTSLPIPDEPRYVEAHGLAADPASWQRTLGAGGCVGSDDGIEPLICVWGDAPVADVVALANEHPAHALLVPRERTDLVEALRGAGRAVTRAVLHTHPDPDAMPDYEGAAPLPADADLSNLPAELREELDEVRSQRTIWAAWVDGEPVSFAYAPTFSARWFDVSVDTVPGARQLGLATIVSAAMIRAERAQGREPVWGALEDNVASLRLARRLGFEPVDELWVAAPRESE